MKRFFSRPAILVAVIFIFIFYCFFSLNNSSWSSWVLFDKDDNTIKLKKLIT